MFMNVSVHCAASFSRTFLSQCCIRVDVVSTTGMALCFPGMKAKAPLPHPGAPTGLGTHAAAAAAASSIHIAAEVPPPPGVPVLQKFDLRTLWSRGAGRVMVDPTTAVAMDHRDK